MLSCFPYARQPGDPSYSKRSGLSSSVNLSRFNPASFAKYRDLVEASGSPAPSPEKKSFYHFDEKGDKPFLRKRTPSTAALDNPKLSTISTSFPNIEVLSLHEAPLAENMTPLLSLENESNNGYHHWTAKSGTLIANMLVAAGITHSIMYRS